MNKITKKWVVIFLVAVNIVFFSNAIAHSQPSSIENTISNNQCFIDPGLNLTVTNVALAEGNSEDQIKMGDRIDVGIKILQNKQLITLNSAIEQNLISPRKLVLYLNDYALEGVTSSPVSNDKLRFQLKRTATSLDSWNAILGGSLSLKPRNVKVSLGCLEGISIPSGIETQIDLNTGLSKLFLVMFVFLLLLFLRISRDSIRDDSPVPSFSYDLSEDKEIPYNPSSISSFAKKLFGKRYKNKPPFSLGRTQMAWWFFIVTGSFLFIFTITGDLTNIINGQALVLIGISASTGISAVLIDDGKNSLSAQKVEKLQSEIKSLKNRKADLSTDKQEEINNINEEITEKEKSISAIKSAIPKSSGFIKDLLTNENGVSFHRYQIFVWTIILGIIFLIEIVKNLKFPEFDSSLLTLQGISAGTYLGFKFPENSKSMNNSDISKSSE